MHLIKEQVNEKGLITTDFQKLVTVFSQELNSSKTNNEVEGWLFVLFLKFPSS